MSAVNPKVVEAIAGDLVEAAAFTTRSGAASLDEAYAIQDAVAERLVADGVRKPVAGYKLAVNSRMLMERFGVSEPASGRLFGDQIYQSPAELRASSFRQFAYEPEIAAIMAFDLPASEAPFGAERVAGAILRFVPAFELLDLRNSEMPKIGLTEAVAQNITNAGIVIGGPGIAPSELDPATIKTVVEIDGKPELSVMGAAPQHPIEAVTWLANHLAGRGLSLQGGHVVLCGTHAPIRPVKGAARIQASMTSMGEVTLTLA